MMLYSEKILPAVNSGDLAECNSATLAQTGTTNGGWTDANGFQAAARELKRLEQSQERLKDLYIRGDISRSEYNRRRDGLEAEIRGAKANTDLAAPDLRNLQEILKRLDHIVELIKEGNPAQQREAIDARIERAEEKDGPLVRVIPREWARALFQARVCNDAPPYSLGGILRKTIGAHRCVGLPGRFLYWLSRRA